MAIEPFNNRRARRRRRKASVLVESIEEEEGLTPSLAEGAQVELADLSEPPARVPENDPAHHASVALREQQEPVQAPSQSLPEKADTAVAASPVRHIEKRLLLSLAINILLAVGIGVMLGIPDFSMNDLLSALGGLVIMVAVFAFIDMVRKLLRIMPTNTIKNNIVFRVSLIWAVVSLALFVVLTHIAAPDQVRTPFASVAFVFWLESLLVLSISIGTVVKKKTQ